MEGASSDSTAIDMHHHKHTLWYCDQRLDNCADHSHVVFEGLWGNCTIARWEERAVNFVVCGLESIDTAIVDHWDVPGAAHEDNGWLILSQVLKIPEQLRGEPSATLSLVCVAAA